MSSSYFIISIFVDPFDLGFLTADELIRLQHKDSSNEFDWGEFENQFSQIQQILPVSTERSKFFHNIKNKTYFTTLKQLELKKN